MPQDYESGGREDSTASTGAAPIRAIFKKAFAAVGFQYFNPHSFRRTLELLGGQRCKTPEEYKAWSQNLGHEHVLTTFCSYGDVSSHRQTEIMRSLADPSVNAAGWRPEQRRCYDSLGG